MKYDLFPPGGLSSSLGELSAALAVIVVVSFVPPSPMATKTQNVLPDESLAPALLDAGKRLLKFLQQRFGLFASGTDANQVHGPAAAAAVAAGEPHALS